MSEALKGRGTLQPWTVVDHYRIVRLLGRGGMGDVYLARDTHLGRMVALKLLKEKAASSPEWVKMFLTEAQAIAKINHPNIVTVYGIGHYGNRPYLSLEYIDGETLRQRARDERLTSRDVIHIGRSVACALEAAHAKGVLHRDLKPGNVLIGADGRVRVLDFGVAKLLDQSMADRLLAPPSAVGPKPKMRVGTPSYMAPEQWSGDEAAPSDIWSLGVILHELVAGHRPYQNVEKEALAGEVRSRAPVPVSASLREVPTELHGLILSCLEKVAERRPSAEELVASFTALAEAGAKRSDGELTPFRGLLPFTEEHVDLFFGREAETAELVERFRHAVVFPVAGPSGVGKSSFVRAGLIPRLREQGSWLVIRMRPLTRPLHTLAARVLNATEKGASSQGISWPISSEEEATRPDNPSTTLELASNTETEAGIEPEQPEEELAKRLAETPNLLSLMLSDIAEQTNSQVLLFVDQLEEVVTLSQDGEEQRAFVEAICSAVCDPQEPVRVVMTLRDDYLGRIPWGRSAQAALGNVMMLGTPPRERLRAVITGPLERTGYRLDDDALADGILDDFGEETTSLPLLQFALRALWDRRDRDDRVLTRAAYVEMGALGGAMAAHADRVLDSFRADEVEIARELLLRLVTSENTRRVLSRRQLLEGFDKRASDVLERLVAARLLTLHRRPSRGEGVDVELAHDSLIAAWGTLSRWLDENHDEVRALAVLTEAAELWERQGRRSDQLWEGDALRDAERTVSHTSAVPQSVAQFVAEGVLRRRGVQRRRRALAALLLGLVVAVALASLFAAWANSAREQEASRGRARAEQSRALLLEEGARSALEREAPLEAMAKLRTALQIRDSVGSRALWRELLSGPLFRRMPTNGVVYDVAFSPDGRLLAAANQAKLIHVINIEDQGVHRIRGPDDQVLAVVFSHDGRLLASATWDGVVSLWQVGSWARVGSWQHEGALTKLAFSADDTLLAAACNNGGVFIRDLGAEKSLPRLAQDQGETWNVAFAPDGDLLAATGTDGTLRLLHGRTGAEALRVDVGRPVGPVDFGSGGKRIALAAGGAVSIWDAASGQRLDGFAVSEAKIRGLAFSPDGRRLATSGYDGAVREWELGSKSIITSRHEEKGVATSVAYSPDGELLAGGFTQSLAIIRAGDSGGESARKRAFIDQRALEGVALSPDGRFVAAGGDRVVLWDLKRGEALLASRTTQENRGLCFLGQEQRVVVGDGDGIVRVLSPVDLSPLARFDIGRGASIQAIRCDDRLGIVTAQRISGEIIRVDSETGEIMARLAEHRGTAHDLAIAPEGDGIYSAGADGRLLQWDLESEEHTLLLDHSSSLRSLDISADGETLAVSAEDGVVFLVDRATAEVSQIATISGRAYEVRFIGDGQRLVVASSDGSAYVIGRDGQELLRLRGHRGEVNSLVVSPEGELAVTVGDDATVRVHRLVDGRPLWHGVGLVGHPLRTFSHRGWRDPSGTKVAAPDAAWAQAVSEARLTSQDEQGLCVLSFNDRLQRWPQDAPEPSFERSLANVERLGAVSEGCLIVRDGEALLITADGEYRLTDGVRAIARQGRNFLLASEKAVTVHDGRGQLLEEVAVGPGVTALHLRGTKLALGYAEGSILIRELSESVDGLELRDTPLSSVAVIEDGLRGTLIAGFSSGFVGLWDISNGTLLSRLRLHGVITDVAYEGGFVVAASDLGDQAALDLRVLERPYCDVIRDIWDEVPLLWRNGRVTPAIIPEDHPCRQ